MMKKKLPFLLLLMLCTLSCEKEMKSNFPYAEVRLELNLEDPRYTSLQAVGNIFIPKRTEVPPTARLGFGGLIIGCYSNDNYTDYYVFDLACPNEAARGERNLLKVEGIYAKCSKCGEEYDLIFGVGNPTKGISKDYLERYHATRSGYRLNIRN